MSVNAVESLTPFEFWARNDKDGKDEQDLMGDNAPYAAAYRTITGGPHTPLAPFLPAQQLRRAGHRFERLTLPFSLRRHKRRRGLDRLDDPIKHLPSGRSLFWPRLAQSPMRDNPMPMLFVWMNSILRRLLRSVPSFHRVFLPVSREG